MHKFTHPFFEGLTPTLHIAHRGGSALAPENTMVAFEQAVQAFGTDMLEIDVHLTADGVMVVFHDDDLDRTTDGRGPIAARTLAALREVDAGYHFTPDKGQTFPWRGRGVRVPRLDETLEAFPDLRFNIEVKTPNPHAVVGLLKVVRDLGAIDRVCIGSAKDRIGARLAAAAPEACHFYPQNALARYVLPTLAGLKPHLDRRYTVLDMPDRLGPLNLITPRLLRVAGETGRWVNVWTIDDPVQMGRLIQMGVGGVMTDRPDRLTAALAGC